MARKNFSFAFKTLIIFSLAIGMILNLTNTTSVRALMAYYTLQSNFICLVAFICFVILEIKSIEYKSNDMYYLIKGAITIAIFITAFVYLFTLAPTGFEMDSLNKSIANKMIANLFVHVISPILVISDYFLFDEKGNFKLFYPVFWLIFPLNYVFYVYTYSYSGGTFYSIGGSKNYAYFFLDYEEIGYLGVAKWLMLMAAVILAISYFWVFLDGKLKK